MDRLVKLLSDPAFLAINGAVVILVGVAFVLGWSLARRAKRIGREIDRSIDAIRVMPAIPGREALAELERRFPRGIGFTEQWKEFCEGIVELPYGTCFNSLPLASFVRDEAVLATVGFRRVKFPVVHSLPGICTSLGILGTFLGISFGLWGVDAEDPSAGIQPLISGLSSAFYTSIVGVVASMVLGLVAGHREAQLLASVHEFVDVVEQKIPRVTSEKLLAHLLHTNHERGARDERLGQQLLDALKHQIQVQTLLRNEAGEQTRVLKDARDVARASGLHLEQLVSASASAAEIQRQVREQAGEQIEILENIRQDQAESRVNLQTIANDLADKLGSRIEESFVAVLAPQLEKMAEAVNSQVSHVGATHTDQARRFADEMVQQLTTTLDGAFAGMGQQVDAASRSFGELSATMGAMLEGARSAVDEQRAALSESGAVVERANEAARVAAQEVVSMSQLAGQFGRLTELLEAHQARALSLQDQQMALQTSAAEQTAHLGGSLAEANRTYSSTAQELSKLLPALSGMVGEFRAGVAQLVAASAEASQSVEQSSTSLRQRASDEKQLLDGFRQAAGQFSGAFREAGPALAGFEKAASELSQQRQSVNGALERLNALTKGLEATGAILHDGLRQAETSLGGAARGIADVVRSTEAWADEASAAVQRFGQLVREAVEGSLKEYDRSLASAVTSLGAAMRDLDEVAEEIRAAAHQRRTLA